MKQKLLINGETIAVSQEGTLVIERFLVANYRFRRNILNGKVEFATLPKAADAADSLSNGAINEANLTFRPLTQEALNSIVIRAKRENILEKGGTERAMDLYVRFRGGEPTVNALLERDGIKAQEIK